MQKCIGASEIMRVFGPFRDLMPLTDKSFWLWRLASFSAGGRAACSAEETEGNRGWAGQVLGGPEGCSGETGTVREEGHRCEFTTVTPSETHVSHYSGTPQHIKYQYQLLQLDWTHSHDLKSTRHRAIKVLFKMSLMKITASVASNAFTAQRGVSGLAFCCVKWLIYK